MRKGMWKSWAQGLGPWRLNGCLSHLLRWLPASGSLLLLSAWTCSYSKWPLPGDVSASTLDQRFQWLELTFLSRTIGIIIFPNQLGVAGCGNPVIIQYTWSRRTNILRVWLSINLSTLFSPPYLLYWLSRTECF